MSNNKSSKTNSSTTNHAKKNRNEKVILHVDKEIATLKINRPEVRNALDIDVIEKLIEHLQVLQKNDEVRIIVLRGEGEHFSAGADIEWMRKSIQYNRQQNLEDALKLANLLYLLSHIEKIIIGLVKGSVYGGALGLIACCDIVIAEPNAKFCFSEVKLGLIPAVVGPYVLRSLGEQVARFYMLTAEAFTAETALNLRLINEIAPLLTIETKLEKTIEKLLQNGPEALVKTKCFINDLVEEPRSGLTLVEYTAEIMADLRVSKEAQEGLSAFLEKRSPQWPS